MLDIFLYLMPVYLSLGFRFSMKALFWYFYAGSYSFFSQIVNKAHYQNFDQTKEMHVLFVGHTNSHLHWLNANNILYLVGDALCLSFCHF